MKRLLPAVILLTFAVLLCFYSHVSINRHCDDTMKDINDFYSGKISSETVQNNWHARKDKMSIFANHEFLDKITIYVGQLTTDTRNSNDVSIYLNIKTVLSMIKDEQRLSEHSFY